MKSYMQIISSPPLPPLLDLLVARVTGDVYGTCVSCTYIVYVCYGIVPAQAGAERLYHRPRKRAHVIRSCLPAAVPSLSLFLFSRTDFNADEGRRCANVKGGGAVQRGREGVP